ncbi:MAG: hypothetical protein K9H50_04670 [Aurantimicrobium sp.]|nr:hypothetical protein [Aurantimicrobium sp.]
MSNQMHVGVGKYIGGGVTVFPVWPESPETKRLCWKPSHLSIGELGEGAQVNLLEVTNNGTRPHVVVEGDIFEGGWQTRTAATTVVIQRGETVRIPVACVEQGRWNGRREHDTRRVRKTPYRSRSRMTSFLASQNEEAMMSGGPVDMSTSGRPQQSMWEDIREMQEVRGFAPGLSLSLSMDDIIDNAGPATDHVDAKLLPGQRGVIIGIGGYIAAAEIFGSTDGLKQRFDAIIDAARYEALDAPRRSTPNYLARDFARVIAERTPVGEQLDAPAQVTTPIGPLAVTSFALANVLVHAAVFNQVPREYAGVN